MNIRLKTKLTISYILLSLLLVGSILLLSNYFLEKKFQSYIVEKQEEENLNIINLVTNAFGDHGELPSQDSLENIGATALSQGLVLMVNDVKNDQLYCTSTIYSNDMIQNMKVRMASVYPNFHGQYTEKIVTVTKNNTRIGTITLGYYGPFFYNEEDVQFLRILNKIYIGVAGIFLAIAAFLGNVMANRISRPIRKVIDQTRQIELGNYTDRLTLVSKTKEMDQLIHSVNTLADTLERQQNSKKRMSRDYAHELRTPLATLQLNLEAMIDGIWEPTAQRLESCREEILRLTRMLSDIDKIVKIEDDSLLLNKTYFDLSGVIEKIVLTFQPIAETQNITIETLTLPCEIYADQDKISQVIVNLISNAVKYTDQDGKINIAIIKNKNQVELIVSDTGIGISPEDLPNIFDHLFRTDQSRDRGTGGYGIGLSVVKGIVEAHAGRVEVQSEPNKGSKFTVVLPL